LIISAANLAKALALQQANHADGGKYIGYVAMAKLLTGWRNSHETAWLKDAPVHPLQHSLKDLERAYRNFFEKHADFPRFKKKWQSDSFLPLGMGRFSIPVSKPKTFGRVCASPRMS